MHLITANIVDIAKQRKGIRPKRRETKERKKNTQQNVFELNKLMEELRRTQESLNIHISTNEDKNKVQYDVKVKDFEYFNCSMMEFMKYVVNTEMYFYA